MPTSSRQKDPNTAVLLVRVPREMHEEIRSLATSEDLTMAQLTRLAIRRFLAEARPEEARRAS